jgi:hypothetical protein
MHAAKTLGWAGATPLLTAFSRPNQSEVAPARPEQLGAVFCRVHAEMQSDGLQSRSSFKFRKERFKWQS